MKKIKNNRFITLVYLTLGELFAIDTMTYALMKKSIIYFFFSIAMIIINLLVFYKYSVNITKEYEKVVDQARDEYQSLKREYNVFKKHHLDSFARDVVSVCCDMDKAIDYKDKASVKSITDGIKIIRNEYDDVFTKYNIKRINSINKPFDSRFAEAVDSKKTDEVKPGTVIQEISAGYTIDDRVLLPAKVVISEKQSDWLSAI